MSEMINEYGETPSQYAWKLIKNAKWSSKSNEKFAVLCVAEAMERNNNDWVPVSFVAHASQWSITNTKEQVERPRNDDKIIFQEMQGRDGKLRRYYSLKGWK